VLGTFTADDDGNVEGTVTIPENTRPGTYLFLLVGQTSGISASTEITVERNGGGNGRPGWHDHGRPGWHDHGRPAHGPEQLAKTGPSDTALAVLGGAAGLMILGGGTLVLTKRRRSQAQRG